jgi:hypothetical protein
MRTYCCVSLMFVLCFLHKNAQASGLLIQHAYLDKSKNVHIVTSSKIDLQLTKKGYCYEPQLAEDGTTVAWISNLSKDSNVLMLYRFGKVRSIKGDPFVRGFWFVDKGKKIALDLGGAHFAGMEVLYDVVTLKPLESYDQWNPTGKKRPIWSTNYQ